MATHPTDLILKLSRAACTVGMALALAAGSIAVAVIPVIFLAPDKISFAADDAPLAAAAPLPFDVALPIVGILALVAAMAGCAWMFLRKLRGVVNSVSSDPFVPANAERLTEMGWLTVAINLLALIISAMGTHVATLMKDATADFQLSFGGLFMALLLFVLARVFREGARLRAEVEGTV